MARRPKRSLAEELTQHAAVAVAAADLVSALAKMQPEIAEFSVARRMLNDGLAELIRSRNEAAAVPASAQPSLPVAP